MARWLEQIAPYSPQLVYRSGKAHGNADALSRRLCLTHGCRHCAVREDKDELEDPSIARCKLESWADLDKCRDVQRQDPILRVVVQWLEAGGRPSKENIDGQGEEVKVYWSLFDSLFLENGCLYRRWESPDGLQFSQQLVVPEVWKKRIWEEVHALGHFAENRTAKLLRDKFYWVGVHQDVHDWCLTCQTCKERSQRCKTINLAHVSVDTLRKRATKLQKIPRALERSPYEECHIPEYIPPPPREIKKARIQICRPRPVDFVSPPVPCICAPCPVCPTRGEQLRNLAKITFKIAIFYFLIEATTKKQIWGTPDGTTHMVTNFSNSIMRLFKKDRKDPDVFGGERVGLIEPDRIRYKLASLWDKTIVFIFTWTIGVPVQLAHDTFSRIETAIIGDDDDKHEDHHQGGTAQQNGPKDIKHVHNKKETGSQGKTNPEHKGTGKG